ncbi:hypothetical protein WJX73_006406 [Symbiochloris irregularis]|uniref:Protein N-lysine methyltransferase METTL21A n=1 Tax=Symbiochloris irregularis TaxID=706552 RepID=A0AAW1P182_9CHLO
MADWERWNTHFSTSVEVEVFGVDLRLQQDPSTHNLGTTVWDSSIVFAKYLQQNARKGCLSRAAVKGKNAVELGSGMGLAGISLALMGCDVVLTDIASVLPLLRCNADANLGKGARAGSDNAMLQQAGQVSVAELDWLQPEQLQEWAPGVDIILGTDCMYSEELLEQLLAVVLHLARAHTTVVFCNELRSDSVHSRFQELFGQHFVIKRTPHKKMDATHQHPLIDIFVCKLRKQAAAAV